MIWSMERSTEAYYPKYKAMKLAYKYLMIIALEEAEKWEQEINEIHEVKESLKERWLSMMAQATTPSQEQ